MNTTSGVGTGQTEATDPRLALSAELRDALDREIDPGEKLRWCGQPDPSRVWKRVLPGFGFFGTILLLLTVLCCGVAISTLIGIRAGTSHEPVDVVYFSFGGTVLFGAGSIFFWRQPWVEKAKALRTVFALTNTRIFIVVRSTDGRADLNAYEPSHPLAIRRLEHEDGTGTISMNPGAQTPGGPAQTASFVMVGVKEPRIVERLIRQTFDPPAAKS